MVVATNPHNKLNEFDTWLQQLISTGEMPFLGLYTKMLEKKIREALKAKLQQSRDPLSQFLHYLDTYPAISLVYLTLNVCEGYGTHGTFEVYPFILDALQTKYELNNYEKDKLWKEYRQACLKLGLSISSRRSGTNFMVDEYLRQSGVPIRYVTDLTKIMIRYAQNVGIPDDDDPISIRRWQDGLSVKLAPPFSKVAKKAVTTDDTGYYVRLFIKLLSTPANVSDALSDFEIKMSDVIHNDESDVSSVLSNKGKSLKIPQVLWHINELGVELPPGEGIEWGISFGDGIFRFQGQMESRFIPFNVPLPPSVEIFDGAGRSISRKTALWEDGKNNRLLIFSDTGALVISSKLNNDNPINLEPGEYQLVLRFVPDGLESNVETIRNDPSLYVMPLFLEPGQVTILSRGPAEIKLTADSKPLLIWNGKNIKGVRGNEIYCSTDLFLRAMIPEENYLDGVRYFVRLSHSIENETIDIQLTGDESVDCHIEISEQISKAWQPGVTRILAEICQDGIQRPLVRSSIIVWIGLDRIENRTKFVCSALPAHNNLLPDECDNVLINHNNLYVTYRNEDNRYFRMVFNIDKNKRFVFTSAVPGIFLQLKDYSDSRITERSLKKGATVSISWSTRSELEIFSTTNGYLRLGKFNKRVDFVNSGCKRLALSSLVEYLGADADKLLFVDEKTGFPEVLIHLVSPHEILKFSVNQKSNLYHVLFSLSQEAVEVSLKTTELLSGKSETLSLGCNRSFERAESGINGWLTCEQDFRHDLQISLDKWPDGVWIIDLEAKINGRWGNLSNSRNDIYSSGFILRDGILTTNTGIVQDYIHQVGSVAKYELLDRINDKLLLCYAQEAWDELKWLATLWHLVLKEFNVRNTHTPHLLSISEKPVPEGYSSSWVPMLSITARFPWLYSLPVRFYSDIPLQTNSLFIKCLVTMSRMRFGLLSLFNESVLNQLFAFGYSNIHKMMQGEKPHGFSMKSYKAALKGQGDDQSERMRLLTEDDWLPGDGDYLGVLHYHYALGKLQQKYTDTMAGNDMRRGKALYLCRCMHHYEFSKLPTHLNNGVNNLGYINQGSEDELSVEEESILQIAQFLSLFAKACRWDARINGTLDLFIEKAKKCVGEECHFESTFGYLLHIGKDVFGFYLMLWEAALRTDTIIEENDINV